MGNNPNPDLGKQKRPQGASNTAKLLSFKELSRESTADPPAAPDTSPTPGKAAVECVPKDYRQTEGGNAERMFDANRRNIRFCAELNRWLIWNGKHWELDDQGAPAVFRMAKQVILAIYDEAIRLENEYDRKRLLTFAKGADNLRVVKNMVELVSKMEGIPIRAYDLDKPIGLVALSNGVFDSKTMALREHRRKDYLTKIIDIDYDPDAPCPIWLKFLDTIFCGDIELIRYLQKAVGYSLSGENNEKCFFFLYGQGDNGKSVLIETLMAVMDPYASATPMSTLLAKRNDGAIPNDLARLRGIRLVCASEISENKRLDEERIKSLTGKDRITARFMRAEFFDFTPQFVIWMTGNNKPIIRGHDEAIWSRVKLIPFMYSVPKEDQDKDLRNKLINEKQGILAWIIQGYKAWQSEGLGTPSVIASAVEAYREEMDDLGKFLKECTEAREEHSTGASQMFDAYTLWCQENGVTQLTSTNFGRCLLVRGYEKKRTQRGIFYIGIRLVQTNLTQDGATRTGERGSGEDILQCRVQV